MLYKPCVARIKCLHQVNSVCIVYAMHYTQGRLSARRSDTTAARLAEVGRRSKVSNPSPYPVPEVAEFLEFFRLSST